MAGIRARSGGEFEGPPWSDSPGKLPGEAITYPHYVFDLWMQWWRERRCRGDVIVVRYADDFVIGFEHRHEAEACLEELRQRFARFGLKMHDGKTRLIEFGRHAGRRGKGGGKRPETFDFLGFTHKCARRRSDGSFTIQRPSPQKQFPWHQPKPCFTRFYGHYNGGIPRVGSGNHPWRGAKLTVYEGGTRVCAVIRWPAGGLTGGKRFEERIGYIDVLPTLLAAAGAKPPGNLDGLDFLPALRELGRLQKPGVGLFREGREGFRPPKDWIVQP